MRRGLAENCIHVVDDEAGQEGRPTMSLTREGEGGRGRERKGREGREET